MKLVLGCDSAGAPLMSIIEPWLRETSSHELVNLSTPVDGANKVPGIRAALVHDTYSAERAALSNNAQIITMGARVVGPELAKAIVLSWLNAEFDPASHSAANVNAMDELDSKYST